MSWSDTHLYPTAGLGREVENEAVARKGEVLLCGTRMDARGIGGEELFEGARRSTLDEFAQQTPAADKVFIFR